MATGTTPPPDPATNIVYDDREIVQLDAPPAGLARAQMRVPVQKAGTRGKTYQAPLAALAGAVVSNDVRGGHKYVDFVSSSYFGVPATALTLDRLDPETLIVGNTATVRNPSATPGTQQLQPRGYVLALAPAGAASGVQAYTNGGAATTTKRLCQWAEAGTQEAAGASLEYFDPETVTEVEQGTTYKYVLGELRFFDARRDLNRAMFPQNRIPVPTGQAGDPNWIEASAAVFAHQQNTDTGTSAGEFRLGLGRESLDPVAYEVLSAQVDAQRRVVADAWRWTQQPDGSDLVERVYCYDYRSPAGHPANQWVTAGGGGAGVTALYVEDGAVLNLDTTDDTLSLDLRGVFVSTVTRAVLRRAADVVGIYTTWAAAYAAAQAGDTIELLGYYTDLLICGKPISVNARAASVGQFFIGQYPVSTTGINGHFEFGEVREQLVVVKQQLTIHNVTTRVHRWGAGARLRHHGYNTNLLAADRITVEGGLLPQLELYQRDDTPQAAWFWLRGVAWGDGSARPLLVGSGIGGGNPGTMITAHDVTLRIPPGQTFSTLAGVSSGPNLPVVLKAYGVTTQALPAWQPNMITDGLRLLPFGAEPWVTPSGDELMYGDLGGGGGEPQPAAPTGLAVNIDRQASFAPAAGKPVTRYQYQFGSGSWQPVAAVPFLLPGTAGGVLRVREMPEGAIPAGIEATLTVDVASIVVDLDGHSMNTKFGAESDPSLRDFVRTQLGQALFRVFGLLAIHGQTAQQMLDRALNGGSDEEGGPAYVGTTLPDRTGKLFGIVTCYPALNSLAEITDLRAAGNTVGADAAMEALKRCCIDYVALATERNYRVGWIEEAAAYSLNYDQVKNNLYFEVQQEWNEWVAANWETTLGAWGLYRSSTDSHFNSLNATLNGAYYSADRTHFNGGGRAYMAVGVAQMVRNIAADNKAVVLGDQGNAGSWTNDTFDATQLLYDVNRTAYADMPSMQRGTGANERAGQPFCGADGAAYAPDGSYTINQVQFDYLQAGDTSAVVDVWALVAGGGGAPQKITVGGSRNLTGSLDWGASIIIPVVDGTYTRVWIQGSSGRLYTFGLHLFGS